MKLLTYSSTIALLCFVATAPYTPARRVIERAVANVPVALSVGTADVGLDPQVRAIKQSIIIQESNGKHWAVNPDSGALGLGQVMPENLPSWGRQAIGRPLTRDEFLRSPSIQHRVLNHKLTEYWNMTATKSKDPATRARMVASIWYSGRWYLWDSSTPQWYNGQPYPSIGYYTRQTLERAVRFGFKV